MTATSYLVFCILHVLIKSEIFRAFSVTLPIMKRRALPYVAPFGVLNETIDLAGIKRNASFI